MASKMIFKPEEIAAALGCNIRTIYRHINDGKLPAVKPSGEFIITRSDLAKYLGGEDRVNSIFPEVN